MASVLMFLPQTPRPHRRPPQTLGTSLSPCASCCRARPGLVLLGHISPTASGQSEVCAWHRVAGTPEPAQKAVLPGPVWARLISRPPGRASSACAGRQPRHPPRWPARLAGQSPPLGRGHCPGPRLSVHCFTYYRSFPKQTLRIQIVLSLEARMRAHSFPGSDPTAVTSVLTMWK